MLLYKEYIYVWKLNNSHILGCCELSFPRACFFFNNIDFEVLTLVYQKKIFVNHLTYESIVCYWFDFL
jgi:hypothetical protein